MLLALVVLDVVEDTVNDWFVQHAFTTAAITGVLVLAVTVLIVDRIVYRRGLRDRTQAIAAQAGLVNRQALRAADAVADAVTDNGDRDSAADAIQTFLSMLMVSAPLLIGAAAPRHFLEECDRLAALLGRAMSATDGDATLPDHLQSHMKAARQSVQDAAQPLLASLDRADRTAVEDDDPDDGA